MTEVLPDPDAAVAGIADGATVLIGGFGTAGQPMELIDALRRSGPRDLTVVNNNAGNGDVGLAALLAAGQVRKIICSFPRQADSFVFDELYRSGRIELELVPQGNLRAAAGRRCGHRRVLHPDRCGHAARRGQGGPNHRRPRLRARVPDPRRRRPDQGLPG
jgi:3-oxoacid CoA-transferase A subunit